MSCSVLSGIQNTQKGNIIIHKSAGSTASYHVSVDFLSVVDVGRGSCKLQQLVRLVHHQRGVELTQLQQVAAEHPTQTERLEVDGWSDEMKDVTHLFMSLPVCLFDVFRDVEEKAAPLQDSQDQVG